MDALSRGMKRLVAVLDVLDEVLEALGWRNIRDDIIKVVELSGRGQPEKNFEMLPGGPMEDRNVGSVPESRLKPYSQKVAGKRHRRGGPCN